MLRLYLNNTLFYSFNHSENPQDYVITSLKLKKEINTLSRLSFSTLDIHPRFPELKPKRSLIVLHDDNLNNGRTTFVGKVLTVRRSVISGNVEVECEELIGCLRDSVLTDDSQFDEETGTFTEHPRTFKYTYRNLITKAFTDVNYNVEVGGLPSLSVQLDEDDLLNNNINTSLLGLDRLSVLYSNVLSYTGATFRFTASGSGNSSTYTPSALRMWYKVDMRDDTQYSRDAYGYLEPFIMPDPSFEYGVNIIEVEIDATQEDPVTGILSYGTYEVLLQNDTYEVQEEELEIEKGYEERKIRVGEQYKTNDYIIYRSELVTRFGRITKAINFGKDSSIYPESNDTTLPESQLYDRASQWANNSFKMYCDKLTVTGIDKYYINPYDSPLRRPIDLADIVRIRMPNHTSYMYGKNASDKIDYVDYCLSIDVDYFNHENDRYVIGPYIPENPLEYRISDIISETSKQVHEVGFNIRFKR